MARKKAPAKSIKWFRAARFGMFLHWGLYSILGRHEWAMYRERIPRDEYQALAQKFNPKNWDPAGWIELAQAAGMRYMCLTTRHHDGFSLFDSRTSDFTSAKTAARRDLVGEFVEACHQAGMGVALYYSVADWSDPGCRAGRKADPSGWRRFVKAVRTQLRELMTNYGRIDYLFYDGCPPPQAWGCASMNAEIRRLQPHILISSRCGLDEDVPSAEESTMADPGRIWESCMMTNDSWGYNYGDHNWKSVHQLVRTLMYCCHNGGNFLLNVGPRANGQIPAPAVRILRSMGQWLKANGEAVYGTDPHPFDFKVGNLCTGRGSVVYIPLQFYHGPETVLAGVGNKVRKLSLLATGESIAFQQSGERILVTGLPEESPDPIMTVLRMQVAGKPRESTPLGGVYWPPEGTE